MSFINKCSTIIRRSDKEIFKFYIDNIIKIDHYDKDNNLIGIRERTLIKENEVYGKYRPAYINKQMYNHPLGFALYNLNNSKDNIKKMKKVIIFERRKVSFIIFKLFWKRK